MTFALRLLLALVGGVSGYELGLAYLPRTQLGGLGHGLLLAFMRSLRSGGGVVVGGFLGRAITRLAVVGQSSFW
jgi:hypothetical protein